MTTITAATATALIGLWIAVVIEGIAVAVCLAKLSSPARRPSSPELGPPIGSRLTAEAREFARERLKLVGDAAIIFYASNNCPACKALLTRWPTIKERAAALGVPLRLVLDGLENGWEQYSSEQGDLIFTGRDVLMEFQGSFSMRAFPYVLALLNGRIAGSQVYKEADDDLWTTITKALRLPVERVEQGTASDARA